MKKYLIVAAHPDDEVLGAGALMHSAAKNGDEVNVCVLSRWSPTRDDNLMEGIEESHKIIGVSKSYVADFGCMRFKDADHHEMVRFIEAAIKDCQPDVLIIHHPGDVHIDHKIASQCCMEACRLPMRQIDNTPDILKVMYMEIQSSTDWSLEQNIICKDHQDTNAGGDSSKKRQDQVDSIENMKQKWGKYFRYNFKSNKPMIAVSR